MVQPRVGLAAHWVVRCGRLQRTLKDGQADRRSNCRDVNRLAIGTCAVTLERLAATTRGSPALGCHSLSNGLRTPSPPRFNTCK